MVLHEINPGPSVGQAFGKGLENAILPSLRQENQRADLSRALEGLNKPGFEKLSYPQQLGQLLPALLSVPGGAQLAGELAPVLNQRATNASYLNYLDQKKAQREATKEGTKSSKEPANGKLGVMVEGPDGEIGTQGYRNPEESQQRNPQVFQSPESTTPLQSMQNEVARPLNAEQIQDEIENIMRSSMAANKPISYGEASQIVNQDQANRLKQNELLEADKERREASFDKRKAEGLAQARNSGLIEEPFEEPIFTKFLDEAKNSKNSNEQFLHAKNKFDEYKTARDSLRRSFDVPGPITGAYRKLTGTYQDKEQILKSLQPQIKTYKKLNLIDQLRNELATTVGLGSEDVETAIYPPPQNQKESWNKFPKNTIKPKPFEALFGEESPEKAKFPGEEFSLPAEKFFLFKEGISKQLEKYPETNLVALRGFLNQQNRYSWQDISKAINELEEEGRFKPDQVQQHEKHIINNPPLPGLAQMFRNFLTETK